MTYLSTHIAPFLLILRNFGMMLGSNKANRAKDESISMLNQILKAWNGGMYCEMELFICRKRHFILCISCIDDDVRHHKVVTWYCVMTGGHLNTQLEVILCSFERQRSNQTCMTHCSKWRNPSLCGCHLEGNRWLCIKFWSWLRTSNIFPRGTVIFPNFHILFGILDSLIFLIN